MNTFRVSLFAVTTAAALTTSSIALADPPHDRHWRGDIHRFHEYDYPRWREGQWYHGHHDGRLGWWWIAAGVWYLYPSPIYPYPNPYIPPAVVIEPEPAPAVVAPPRETVWYYCESSRNYYPYVSVCPEGWRTVPAEPRDAYER